MPRRKTSQRLVVSCATPGTTLLDISGPLQVFATAKSNGECAYKTIVASRDGGPVETDTGLAILTVPISSLDPSSIDTLLIPGCDVLNASPDAETIEWIRSTSTHIRRCGSTCLGAFLAAAAGLLDGKRAATHWRWCETFKERYPETTIENDKIFVRDGSMWSSAGVTAGIDMALAMVEEDIGKEAALDVARNLVVFLKRPGGQSQFSAFLRSQTHDGKGEFGALHTWITERISEDLPVERLAEYLHMSPRTFARKYAAKTDTTPARAIEEMRVEIARRLLETSDLSISEIANKTGLKNYERLRSVFGRHLGISPSEYRQRFSSVE